MFLSSSLIKPAQRSQQMKRYQMPCSRKAASRNKPSTSLIMRRDPTQVFWTVETVPGMEVFRHLSACQRICLTERGQMWLVSCCFLVIRRRLPWFVCSHSCRGRHKSPFICFFSLVGLLFGCTSESLIHTFTDHRTFTLFPTPFLSIWPVRAG